MSQKRQHLIDTALALFYRHGIHAIGINEVIASSGVAKRTLYTHFDSKEALVLATLAQRHEAFIDWLRQCLSGSTNDTETVERVFDALHRWFTGGAAPLGPFRGCFFIHTAGEFGDPNSAIAQYCQYHKQAVRALIGESLSETHPGLLEALSVLMEGAIVSVSMGESSDQVTQRCVTTLQAVIAATTDQATS
ncbi:MULTISPECIES: TetR/AcrR family transcriptional regulator [unclassified Vibrio]|uniref:TetR/AcrR family transcriptional regulator n=1 Tax=unclassified Vibrio TaxID=2614977 RepID=UPI001267D6BF|nr:MULTISPECIES: TetR/AcrR family transcriptional regulator [unclassified Vibrio]QFT39730.1 HTH-type transcriptional repressor ComR [Vibrio sp. THAF64]QGM37763.1 HTH-type transcriptional repressor ComR [Vibrio sp. THAF191d]QGN73106.1 HTH-type transcriptional repressor ComR [Vibrio sp. THAF191c]